jgi:hypothetical protein
VLKHCAANRKRRLSELPNVGPYLYIYIYIYTTLKLLALQAALYIFFLFTKISNRYIYIYIYDISMLKVNVCYVYIVKLVIFERGFFCIVVDNRFIASHLVVSEILELRFNQKATMVITFRSAPLGSRKPARPFEAICRLLCY